MNIPEITSVQTVNVKKNDVILVRYEKPAIPPSKVLEHARDIAARMKDIFPDNKIVIMDSKTDVTIFSPDDSEA